MNDLAGASKSISVLPLMMDDDVKSDCVRKAGSHTRNLLRVKRGIDMVKVLFEHIISTQYVLFLSVVVSWCLCCVSLKSDHSHICGSFLDHVSSSLR